MKRLRKAPILTLTSVVLLMAGEARPDGACCFEDGGCLVLRDWICTDTWGGRYAGNPTDCRDTDHDGDVDDCVPGPFAFDYPKLYWLEGSGQYGKLQRSNLDGFGVETVLTDIDYARSLVADARVEAVFWADSGYPSNQVWRFSPDGIEPVIADASIETIALDKAERKIYWEAAGVFKRANYDGSSIEILLSDNDANSLAIVHDPRKACTYVDADADGDVDLYDFAAFQACFSESEP
jgi:hypothetical protein